MDEGHLRHYEMEKMDDADEVSDEQPLEWDEVGVKDIIDEGFLLIQE